MNGSQQSSSAAEFLRRLYHNNDAARSLMSWPAALRRRLIARQGAVANAIAERLSENLVGDVVLSLPAFSGTFAVSAKSDLFRRVTINGEYESDMAALVRSHIAPDRDVIDVGANVGFYSVMAAQLLDQGRVLAVEPNPEAYRRLVANLARNRLTEKVTIFHGLASDSVGQATLHHIEGMEEYSSMGQIVHASVSGKTARTTSSVAHTVDGLVAAHGLNPGFMKIDVEGADMLVLSGAIETLKRHRPVVLTELSPALLEPMGTSAAAVIAVFERLGYSVIDAENPALRPGTRAYGDILCLPD